MRYAPRCGVDGAECFQLSSLATVYSKLWLMSYRPRPENPFKAPFYDPIVLKSTLLSHRISNIATDDFHFL